MFVIIGWVVVLGAFLGILLAYGFVGPLADQLNAKARAHAKPFHCVNAVLLASMSGYAPAVAVEFGRKVLFTVDRPSFQEFGRGRASDPHAQSQLTERAHGNGLSEVELSFKPRV
jgi:flagellar motor component MotA